MMVEKWRLTKCMPKNEGEVIILLAFFGELEESSFSSLGVQEIYDEVVDVVLVIGDREARA